MVKRGRKKKVQDLLGKSFDVKRKAIGQTPINFHYSKMESYSFLQNSLEEIS